MGKIRAVTLGDEQAEKEQKRKAEARRQTKQSKKKGDADVVEGTELKPEVKKVLEAVEHGDKVEVNKAKEKKARVHSKRYLEVKGMVDKNKLYPLADAIALVKKTTLTKFDGTVELHVNLNAQLLNEKGDFRTSISLPHGTGKSVKVVIADEKVIADIEAGNINFDILVAAPSMMPKLAKVARILGPKGLMPNPKTGTVSDDPQKVADSLTKGKINIKSEPSNPILHFPVGKVSFSDKQLTENINVALDVIGKSKILKVTMAATMGPGVKVALQ